MRSALRSLLTRIALWLEPPRFPSDDGKTSRAAILHQLALFLAFAIAAAAFILVPFLTVRRLENTAILALLAAALALAWRSVRRGSLDSAAALLLVPPLLAFFGLTTFSGGIFSPLVVGVVAFTVVAVLVIRACIVRLLLGATVCVCLALAVLQLLGRTPAPYFHVQPMAAWFVDSLAVLLLARMAVLYARGVERLSDERREIGEAHDRARLALGEIEARFGAVVEHSHDGILFLDRQSTILYRSPSYRRLNGFPDDERVGFNSFETVHPDDLPLVKRYWDELIPCPGGSYRLEYRIRHKDGGWLWVDTSAQNFLHDPEIRAVVITTRDVTERRHAEEERRESEAVFRALFEEANDSVMLLEQDPAGRLVITDVNATACQLHGYAREELIGRPVSELTAASDRPLVRERTARLVAEGRASFDALHMRKDGTEFAMAVSARRVERAGKPPLIFSIERDISDRARTEAALRQSEERYRMLVELSPDPVMVHRGGRIDFANAATAAVFGASSERDLVGLQVSRLVHPGFREIVAERSRQVQEEGRTPGREQQVCLRLDGTPFEVEVASAPILWHGVRASLTVIRDISEQRRSQRLQARYALLNENVRDPMLLVRLDGRIVEANPAAVMFYGYSAEELLALEIFDLRPSEPRDTIIQQMQKARREGIFLETTHVRKDGTPVPVEIYSRKANVDDEEMLLSVVRDVSIRREAEARLRESEEKWRSIINASPDAIIVVSPEGVIQQASRRLFELWGFDPDREILGRSMFDLLVPEDRQRALAAFSSILSGRPEAPAMYHALRKDGLRRSIEVNREVLRDPRGLPTGLVLVLRDVSDRVTLEAQLRQAQKMETVGRLAGGIAHDFNNLLQVILGNAQDVLESMPASAPQRTQLLEVLHAGARSAELTRQLLAFARRQEVVPRVLDLNEAVSGSLKMLRRLIGEDIELVWKPGPALWAVKIDPAQVDQVLANLASNSRDAIAGVGTLMVSTGNQVLDAAWCSARVGAEPGEYVRLSIQDDGAGMSPEVQSHLFEPFFTTKGVGQGTGLGLATVYGVVKQGHGFIDVQSRQGQGTTVSIYLPRTAEAAASSRQQPSALYSRGNETILLVEDEANILLMLKRALAQLGYTVLAADSPAEALRVVEQHPGTLHLVLTDVVMPGMNGRQLFERVTALRPGVRALFMSGHTAEVISQRGVIEEGMPFIQKPFATSALAARIRELLSASG